MAAPVPLSYPDPPLGEGAIGLRPWQEADLGVIAALCRDPDVARFTRVPDPYTDADARAWMDGLPGRLADGEAVRLAIVAGGGEPAGSIGLRIDPLDRDIAEAGYMVAPAARGRGVATAALRLASRWGLRDLGVARVQLSTHVDNPASQRVAERAGFRREGVLRSWEELRGRRVDLVMFSLVAADL
ncbi:MAG TPA: GNAT family N-acetyltransferase [Gaiellales bacterium]|nr:GNAT family N-acetyltransferase [Gaiellales bacterium]